MSDISIDIPWWLVVVTGPIFFWPGTALAAVLCGFFGYRAERSVAQTLLAAAAGGVVLPCVGVLVGMGLDLGAPLPIVVVGPPVALGLLGLWLWRINRAGSRRRAGNSSQAPS